MEPTTVGKCAICGAFEFNYEDEVSGTIFCKRHAGPLRWSAHDVDAYSAALRIAGHYDTQIPLPSIPLERTERAPQARSEGTAA